MTDETKKLLKSNGMSEDIINSIDALINDLNSRKDQNRYPVELNLTISHVDDAYRTNLGLTIGGVKMM